MKLRIRDNSLRFRLSQTEVRTFSEQRALRAQVSFPSDRSLTYGLCSEPDAEPAARFADDVIEIVLPAATVEEWAVTEQVSLDFSLPLTASDALRVLVEKDFACLSPREGEDDTDMFPHPETGERVC